MQQKSLIEIKSFKTNNKIDSKLNIEVDSLEISPAKIYALWGLSGHGKSLLLSLLAGYPNRQWLGNISFEKFSFFNEDFYVEDFSKNRYLNKKFSSLTGKIIYMPQHLPLYKSNNLKIAKELPFLLKAINPKITNREIANLRKIARNKISEDILTKYIKNLSGGERKRLEILIRIYGVKSLAKEEPCIILLDEPTSGLDIKSEKEFLKLLRDPDVFGEGNLSIIISTHSAHLLKEEENFFDEHLLMQKDEQQSKEKEEKKDLCRLKIGLSKDEIYKTLTK